MVIFHEIVQRQDQEAAEEGVRLPVFDT